MSFDRRQYERDVRHALERLDVIDVDVPHTVCQAAGCGKQARYEWSGQWGTFWLCCDHRSLYAEHSRLVRRIRTIPRKRYTKRDG